MEKKVSPARAYYHQKETLSKLKARFEQFHSSAIDKNCLSFFQYYQLASTCLDYEPDLIIELGRSYGNSTFVFNEVAQVKKSQVISICRTTQFQDSTLPLIKELISQQWHSTLKVETILNLIDFKLESEISKARRVVIFWDAHGYSIAEYVLGYLLPLMKNKDCLVIMHDISDVRYSQFNKSYRGKRLWLPETANAGENKLVLYPFFSACEQLVSVVDFCFRNDIAFQTADESFRTELTDVEKAELKTTFGHGFSEEAHWAHFQICAEQNFEQLTFPDFVAETAKRFDEAVNSSFIRKLALFLQQIYNITMPSKWIELNKMK